MAEREFEVPPPEPTVMLMVDRLAEAGMLHRLDRSDQAASLAMPPEQVSGTQLIEIGVSMVGEGGLVRWSVQFERLRQEQKSLAAQVTLATLEPAKPAVASSDQALSHGSI